MNLGIFGMLCLLCIRGLALWVIIPTTFVVWLLACYWFVRRGASMGRFFGWVDFNFMVFITLTILRPFSEGALPVRVPFHRIRSVTHRMSLMDPS
ncbi:hypothetical protein D4765_08625 [Subtercola vilae]|uniref:Uncharacterized protein n=2 Tax=Microbacteriaceae TaxID=85023 RepID=A0A4T2C4E8_9MICO|nr:hypothetical protein D4765_08625 [Subtercola vilae]